MSAGHLVGRLEDHAAETPDVPLYTFLADGKPYAVWRRAEAAARARAAGARLQELGAAGERVLLLYPQGPRLTEAFLGCLYAGALPIVMPPLHPVLRARALARISGVFADAKPTLGLACAESLAELPPDCAPGLRWVETDGWDLSSAAAWRDPGLTADSLAFLQYTSGTTSRARGVAVTHGNVIDNLGLLRRMGDDSLHLTWAPPHHDMGAMGCLFGPMMSGRHGIQFDALEFMEKPARWLRAMSDFGATASGAPNFGFELCVARVEDAELEGVDLSRWQNAYLGAEPIRADTVRRFCERFERFGFDQAAIRTGYGLAECTVMATARVRGRPLPREGNLVGCGEVIEGHELLIVDPATSKVLPAPELGEIWLRGPSVAAGYWDAASRTARPFDARTAGGAGPYLRTGDLGFLKDGELFVGGRLKDVVVVNGAKHLPDDIERAAETGHPGVMKAGVAAFSAADDTGAEKLVVLAEAVERPSEAEAQKAAEAVRSAVWKSLGLSAVVVLVGRGCLKRTTSGKLRRSATRDAFLAGELPEYASAG